MVEEAGAEQRSVPGGELELTVTDLARGGAGVGRAPDGRVVLVPFTAPGDRVRVRIVRVHRRRLEAELVELVEASPDRIEPRCEVFGRCGGCQWQHLPYALQWRTKLRGVCEARARTGVEGEVPLDEMPAEEAWGYRNRVQLRGEGSALGYRAAGSHELVSIRSCPIARPEIQDELAAVRSRGMARGGSYKVELEVLESGKLRTTWDAPHAAAGFRQVHEAQNRRMQAWLRERVAEFCAGPCGELWDLYGGAANLSLPLADRFSAIHCVDPSAPASRPRSMPAHLRFHPRDALRWLQCRRASDTATARVAFLDPPRQGLGRQGPELARLLWAHHVRRVALVSCDPDAHGRDLVALTAAGYRLRRLAVADLFPQTRRVEALAWLADVG